MKPPHKPVSALQCYLAYLTALVLGYRAWWTIRELALPWSPAWTGLVVSCVATGLRAWDLAGGTLRGGLWKVSRHPNYFAWVPRRSGLTRDTRRTGSLARRQRELTLTNHNGVASSELQRRGKLFRRQGGIMDLARLFARSFENGSTTQSLRRISSREWSE